MLSLFGQDFCYASGLYIRLTRGRVSSLWFWLVNSLVLKVIYCRCIVWAPHASCTLAQTKYVVEKYNVGLNLPLQMCYVVCYGLEEHALPSKIESLLLVLWWLSWRL